MVRSHSQPHVRLETGVQHAAHLEFLDVLAGGIAHNFSTFAKPYAGAARAQELTQQLLRSAKGGMPLREPVVLPSLIQEAVKWALREGSEGIHAEYELAEDAIPAFVDRSQIAQAIQQVVVNAVQAMPKGGRLLVGLSNAELGPANEMLLAPGRYLELTIMAEGEGIAPEFMGKAFHPDFTMHKSLTKHDLAAAYSILRRHEGLLEIGSSKGKGSTVRLWIPAADAPSSEIPSIQPLATAAVETGKVRVLLMDDEPSICLIGKAFLKKRGFDVAVASDGQEAMRAFNEAKSSGKPFDVVILDLTVPGGMGGRETIEAIRALDQDVRAIVSSGYSSDPVMADHAKYGFDGCVPKPYELEELTMIIRRLSRMGRS